MEGMMIARTKEAAMNAEPTTPQATLPQTAEAADWLDEVVTDEAKQDPNWREKAMTGRALISSWPKHE